MLKCYYYYDISDDLDQAWAASAHWGEIQKV